MFDVTLIDEILLRNLNISLFKSASLFMDEKGKNLFELDF